MKRNGSKTVNCSAKTGKFVLTSSRGAKISEIEGLKLSLAHGRDVDAWRPEGAHWQ